MNITADLQFNVAVDPAYANMLTSLTDRVSQLVNSSVDSGYALLTTLANNTNTSGFVNVNNGNNVIVSPREVVNAALQAVGLSESGLMQLAAAGGDTLAALSSAGAAAADVSQGLDSGTVQYSTVRSELLFVFHDGYHEYIFYKF